MTRVRRMGSRSDDDYWNNKYSGDPECEDHGGDEMYYDGDEAEWICLICEDLNEFEEIVKYG